VCVQIQGLPTFSQNSALIEAYLPPWGTCPSDELNGFSIENGIIVCDGVEINQIGEVHTRTYRAINRIQLDSLIATDSDLRPYCTSNITNMDSLYYNKLLTSFVPSWDVSNVTSMKSIFEINSIKQLELFVLDLNNWDVSNVEDFSRAFLEEIYKSLSMTGI